MSSHSALADLGIAPRPLTRQQAAAYVSLSPNIFDQLVKDGRMPRPKLLGSRRRAWNTTRVNRGRHGTVEAVP